MRASVFLQVDEFIVKKTVGGPVRFRPRTREELSLEVAALEKQLAAAQRKMKEAAATGVSSVGGSSRDVLQRKTAGHGAASSIGGRGGGRPEGGGPAALPAFRGSGAGGSTSVAAAALASVGLAHPYSNAESAAEIASLRNQLAQAEALLDEQRAQLDALEAKVLI